MKKYTIISLLVLFFNFSFAQNIDSLINVLNNKYADNPNKSLQLISKIYNLTYQTNQRQAIEMAARAIYLCDSILKNPELSAQWKLKLAQTYLEIGTLDQAARYLSEVRDFYHKHKDLENYAISLMYLGDIYHKLKVNQIALDNYNKAEKIFKKLKDWNHLATVLSKKAIIYYDNYKTDSAFFCINKALKLSISIPTKAKLYTTLATLYKLNETPDSAIIFYKKALNIYTTLSEKASYIKILQQIGESYNLKKQYDSALTYLYRAATIAKKLSADKQLADIYADMGVTYFYKNDLQKATQFLLKAIAKSTLTQSSQTLQTSYLYLGKIKEQQNNLAAALHYYKLYIDERSKYFDQIASQGYAEIILMFQNQEKQREIEILKKEEILRTQQLHFLMVVVALLILLMLVVVFMMNKLRKANKLLEQQYEQIRLQKRELESQSKILEKATQDLLKQKEKIQKQNQAINASLKYASRIQKAVLPKPEYFANFFDDFFIYYKPKETVSGDFYWLAEVTGDKPSLFQEEANKKIILAVGDCTGHGVPGAFMAMLGDAYLNQIIKIQRIHKPDEILYELNKNIRATLQQGDTESTDGMDIGICVIDKKTHTMEFAGAKMDLIYVQNGKMVRVHGDIYSVGGLKQERYKKFTSKYIDFTTETIFYLYSDGFQDQFGSKYGRKYMAKRFREFLYKIHAERPLEKQKQLLEEEFIRWTGKKYKQMDDITVIGILLKGKII